MKPILSLALLLGLFTASCQPAGTPESTTTKAAAAPYQDNDVNTFASKKNNPKVVVLEVRTPAETAGGMIAGAIEIDINDPAFADKVGELDKDKTYLVYCRSGRRSARACETMAGLGFGDLYNLAGGYLDWQAAGK